ncbi:pyridoxal phosphate-dependent aminotransferase [Myxococcota bacterium]|nr:pyridoxal phosphate-dependent aminotransferase [Myxococcota bacterium]
MPRHPEIAPAVVATPASPFSRLARRAAESGCRVHPLHIGDTWHDAPAGCRMEDLHGAAIDGLHRYAPVEGLPSLLSALAARLTARHGVSTAPEDVLVTAGATGGLGAVLGALTVPGDEVVVPAPYWPLVVGIIRGAHAVPVVVDTLAPVDPVSSVARLEAALTARTAAVYVNTPNNPTGAIWGETTLDAIVALARRRDLWILADECYEDYAYAAPHVSLRARAPERVVSIHSFSKAFGMAGNRCGYVVGPPGLAAELRKISLHTFYSTPTAAQHAALRALDGPGDAFVAARRSEYAAIGAEVASVLGVAAPEAGTFLFVDLAPRLGHRPLWPFLERCADAGLLLAPGTSFGPYPEHVRLCFTAEPPEAVRAAVARLDDLLRSV